jgi:signal transduction histidine kinase
MSHELKKTQEELRMLLGSIQTSAEEERKHIAREIHDELGQVLTALKIDASLLRKKIAAQSNDDKDYIEGEFNSMIKLIDSSIESVKRIATELRPEVLDHLGIMEAIKWQVEEFENNTGIRCIINDLQSHPELNAALATTVYRIIQEALTNIARHSKATVVNLLVGVDANNFLIEIKDNGKGIKNEETEGIKSLGLIGMRERVFLLNGTISIIGKPGKGTVVSVKIPM